MLTTYIQNRQQMLEASGNFYTPSGIQVFTKDEIANNLVDMESVISKFESKLPAHVRDNVEMIIVGEFDEFEDRGINAFYKDSALYVSNIQTDNEDLLDDLVHETAHSIEEAYGYEIYADEKIKNEFLKKRFYLYEVLCSMGFKVSREVFLDTEYTKEFDMFLLQDVGYDKLSEIGKGIFISPYAATSLREYFATAFTEFYMYPDSHGYLQKVSPEVYKKLAALHVLDKA